MKPATVLPLKEKHSGYSATNEKKNTKYKTMYGRCYQILFANSAPVRDKLPALRIELGTAWERISRKHIKCFNTACFIART